LGRLEKEKQKPCIIFGSPDLNEKLVKRKKIRGGGGKVKEKPGKLLPMESAPTNLDRETKDRTAR
jgi:hypothetical protein